MVWNTFDNYTVATVVLPHIARLYITWAWFPHRIWESRFPN